jgi:hypothetical protein
VRSAADEATAAEADGRTRLAEAETQANERRQELLRTISSLTTSRNRLGELEREQDRVAFVLSQLEHERVALVARRDETELRYRAAAEDSRSAAAPPGADGRRRELVERRTLLGDEAKPPGRGRELGRSWEAPPEPGRHRARARRHAAVLEQLVTVLSEDAWPARSATTSTRRPAGAAARPGLVDWLELPVIAAAGLSGEQLQALAGLEGRLRLAVAGGPARRRRASSTGWSRCSSKAGVKPEHLPWLGAGAAARLPVPRPGDCPPPRRAAPHAIFVGPDDVCGGRRSSRRPRLAPPRRARPARRAPPAGRRDRPDQRARGLRGEPPPRHGRPSPRSRPRCGARRTAAAAEQERAARGRRAVARRGASRLRASSRPSAPRRAQPQGLRELVGRRAELEQEVAGLGRGPPSSSSLSTARDRPRAPADEAADALRRLDRWQAEARLAEERATAAAAEHERLAGEGRRLDERIAKLQGDVDHLGSELAGTEEEVVRSRTRLAEEQGLLSAARDRERQLGEQVTAVAASVEGLDREVRQRRDEHDRARESLHETEVEQTRLDSQWERLRDAAAAELDTTPEALLTLEPDPEATPDALRETITGLRAKIEALGPVNLLALKEVDELEQRSTFLSAQLKDLVEALHKLEPRSARSTPSAARASSRPWSRSTACSTRPSTSSSAAAAPPSSWSTRTTPSSRASTSRLSRPARRPSRCSCCPAARRR